MSHVRFRALDESLSRKPIYIETPPGGVAAYYGENVFGRDAMRLHLSEEAYNTVMAAIEKGERIDRNMAEVIAAGMKNWSVLKGATHYTHWFQPLTGTTAEKHDAFFEPVEGGRAIERFGGTQLVQQEPDASSFPNGGIRNTFEARGYTAWDPTSPAFIIGDTLCIPTIFVSYTGDTLDFKSPLLKALASLDKAAVDVCQYFDKNVTKVIATLGWEQEYFLVDEALNNARPDLVTTGRTLFGAAPAKGQQLDDHYFGSIPDRATSFMRDLEIEAHKLGIPIKTRHNEVAPNQFECAPIYEEINLAVDHNQLLMDLMQKVARRHNFCVLLHEKPYAGVNGSGKHNNWSLATNLGKNLLSPGKTPKTNLQFLTFFVNTIKAFHDNDDLLRATIASAGNDHRLGANEAPPAIMSVFLGSQLTAVLDEIEEKVKSGKMTPDQKTQLKLNIGKIPDILLDNTDRNRTSPFAFTGNKFEFRAVGSAANCSGAMTVVNTIMTDTLVQFKKDVDALIVNGVEKDEAIFQILRDYIVASKRVRFEGNGYGEEWVVEATKRGLNNFKTTPEALDAWLNKKYIKMFERHGVLTEREQHARYEIYLETYVKKIQIESRAMGDIAMINILPTALQYQNTIIKNVLGLKQILSPSDYKNATATQLEMITAISAHVNGIKTNVDAMIEARRKANNIEDWKIKAEAYCNTVKPFFDIIRDHVDKLEMIVADEVWPLPKYRELLFTK